MTTLLREQILDVFRLRNKTRQKNLKDGSVIEYRFVTFRDISEYIKEICLNENEKYPGPRELKRQLIKMIENDQVGEVFGEPPIFMLKDEFVKYTKYQKDKGVV